ncbi:hypothetical protein Pelo_19867 [Pelomyxa schiedti]|nr:hypothetical protein Pelo_19867 [Pelomyxa schiedti]
MVPFVVWGFLILLNAYKMPGFPTVLCMEWDLLCAFPRWLNKTLAGVHAGSAGNDRFSAGNIHFHAGNVCFCVGNIRFSAG